MLGIRVDKDEVAKNPLLRFFLSELFFLVSLIVLVLIGILGHAGLSLLVSRLGDASSSGTFLLFGYKYSFIAIIPVWFLVSQWYVLAGWRSLPDVAETRSIPKLSAPFFSIRAPYESKLLRVVDIALVTVPLIAVAIFIGRALS